MEGQRSLQKEHPVRAQRRSQSQRAGEETAGEEGVSNVKVTVCF